MKTMLLTLMMVVGFALNQTNAQVASCQPCPPGCCVTKGCTPEDCAKKGCDISKCNTSASRASLTTKKDSKMCCATDAKVSSNQKMCCAADAKSATAVVTAVSLFAPCSLPAQKTEATVTTLASITTPQGKE